MARKKKTMQDFAPAEGVQAILDQKRVIYLPIVHFSPACAWHVGQLIRAIRPVGVLVEGPEDATELIPFMVHPETETPFTIFSYYVDKRNVYGLNGILSPNEEVPARLRGWWPFTDYAPELEALRAGQEVGAALEFIDVPLHTIIDVHHARLQRNEHMVADVHLFDSAFASALVAKQRRRSIREFWNANYEVGGWALDEEHFRRAVLTLAWCSRAGLDPNHLEVDGTHMREAHMRYRVERFLKENPEGPVVVVTGAFHTVALPWTAKKKAKIRKDKNLETMLTAYSFRALANLYQLNRKPAYLQMVWDRLSQGAAEPYNDAALTLLLEVMRQARDEGDGVSTADSVGAYQVARNLATMRRNHEVTLEDLEDAIQMGYIKGDIRLKGSTIRAASEQVLVGKRVGSVTDEVGQPPLFRDYYQRCKSNRIQVTGEFKTVRCDVHKYKAHQLKSALLHQCDYLQVPMFTDLETGSSWRHGIARGHYRGPDLTTGQDMHLITETWGIEWRQAVDDRLIALSDRGATLGQASQSMLREEAADATGHAAQTTRLLLKSAQMMLLDMFDELLMAVEEAIIQDTVFVHLTTALQDFTILHSYRDTLATQGHQRLLRTVLAMFNRATLVLPSIAGTPPEETLEALEALQTLVRIAITFDAVELDRQLLVERLEELVSDPDANPGIRGAGYGILFSLGATREKVVAQELKSYLLGAPERVLQAGPFLEGLFISSKNIVMGNPRLLRAINSVLGELDWDIFKMLLPDLRRAFTQFIPSEIDELAERVSIEIGMDDKVQVTGTPPDAVVRIAAAADRRVGHLLEQWMGG
ncbi:MAG: DUF5682 family protein [Myxococcota bacterium]